MQVKTTKVEREVMFKGSRSVVMHLVRFRFVIEGSRSVVIHLVWFNVLVSINI